MKGEMKKGMKKEMQGKGMTGGMKKMEKPADKNPMPMCKKGGKK